jgi:hypothetical protein
VLDILDEIDLFGSKLIESPMGSNFKLYMEKGSCYLIWSETIDWLVSQTTSPLLGQIYPLLFVW